MKIEDTVALMKQIRERNNRIDREKELFRKYNHIKIGKTPSEMLNVNQFPEVPVAIKEKVNTESFFLEMVNRLDYVNEMIIEVFMLWEVIEQKDTVNNLINKQTAIIKHRLLIESIVHELKIVIDRLIALTWCASHGTPINRIEIDSIGNISKDSDFTYYGSSRDYLTTINNIDNACKHSFVCHEANVMGRCEPGIWINYDKGNKLQPQIVGASLNQIVDGFNELYREFVDTIKGF